MVLRSRQFVGWLLIFGLSMGVIFAYVATSAFVLQSMNGLSPVLYSVDFAFNAVGLTVTTLVAAKLAGSVSTRSIIAGGLAATAVAAVLLLIGALIGMPLPIALIGFFVLMSAQGLVGPNAGALASGTVPDDPGTGSALLGFLQWFMAGVIAPLAGLGGEHTAVPMATIVAVLTAVSVFALVVLARARRSPIIVHNKEQS
jgi:DHA1 family bicyclomycin/chloramphenicol resistance-like MFS transporter